MKKNDIVIDILKIIFALGIIGLHTGFLLNYKIGFYIHTILFRLGVPFFFFSSGYFLATNINDNNNKKEKIIRYIKKLSFIYLLLSFIYMLLNMIRFHDFSPSTILSGLYFIFTGRSQSVMWFLGALICSAIIILHIKNQEQLKKSLKIFTLIYLVGLLFNTYCFLINENELQFLYSFLCSTFINNSNFLFVGFLFFGLGYYVSKYYKKTSNLKSISFSILGFILLIIESVIVKKHINVVSNYEYFVSHLFIIPSIFLLARNIKTNKQTEIIRKLSSYFYYFHYIIIILLILFNEISPNNILNSNLGFYLTTVMLTLILSIIFFIYNRKSKIENTIIKYILFLLYCIVLISLIFSIKILFNNVIWADEICSLAMIKNSFKKIVLINAYDVHPPVYYSALKIFIDIVFRINNNINLIVWGKIFSFIPLILLIIFINIKIKKDYGKLTSAILTVFVVLMPQMMYNFVEIRMYSWGMTLVLLAFVYLLDVIKKNDKKSWIIFTIFSILAVYIHFYSCLIMLFLYLFLISYYIFIDRKQIKKCFISGIIVSIAFLPWLLVILFNLNFTSSAIGIAEITITSIVEYIKYIFYPNSEYKIVNLVLTFANIISILFILYKSFKISSKKSEFLYNSFGILGLAVVIITGVAASILLSPMFASRYMFFGFGIFWFCVAIHLNNIIKFNKKYLILLLAPLLVGIIHLNSFFNTEIVKQNNIKDYYENIKKIEKDAIIVSNNTHVQFHIAYFKPNNKVYLYQQSNAKQMVKMYGNIVPNGTPEKIKEYLSQNKKVYYLEYISEDHYKEEMETNHLKLNKLASFSADWYYMNFYEIVKEGNKR